MNNTEVATKSFEDIFDRISSFFENHSVLADELVSARADYFKLTGKLNESDLSFTNRMNAFLLWFTFDWRCSQSLKSPFEMFKEEVAQHEMESGDIKSILDLEDHVHSLFESKKLNERVALVKDLYTKKKYEIVQPDFLYGSRKGLYFETRLFSIGTKYQFSNYFIPHPAEVKKDVMKRCKLLAKKGDSIKPFLIQLHAYHTKWERYRNINIKSIYHFDKSIPEAK